MRGQKSITVNKPIAVTPDNLSRLLKAIGSEDDGLSFKVACSDGTILHPEQIEELLNFPNSEPRSVAEIRISSSYSNLNRWDLEFSNRASIIPRAASFTVYGEMEYLLRTMDAAEQHLGGMAAPGLIVGWKLKTYLSLLAGGIVTAAGMQAMNFTLLVNLHKALYWERLGVFGNGVACIALLIIAAFAWKGDSLIGYFFPACSFLIGAGERRYKRMASTRKNLFWGVGIALLVALIGDVLITLL